MISLICVSKMGKAEALHISNKNTITVGMKGKQSMSVQKTFCVTRSNSYMLLKILRMFTV